MKNDASWPRRLALVLILLAVLPACVCDTASAEEEEEEDAAWEAEWRARWQRCRTLDQAWQAAPDDPDAIRDLARAALDASRGQLSNLLLPHLTQYVDSAKQDWEARLLLGRTQAFLNRDPRGTYAKLDADLDAALEKDATSAVLKMWKGRLMLRMGELPNQADVMKVIEGAVETLEESVAADRSSYDAWYWLGRAHERLGDAGSAHESYTEAAKLRPRAIAPLGHIKQMQPGHDTYIETLESLRKVDGGHAQATWFLGLQRVEDGEFEAAIKLFEEAATLDPQNAEAPYQLGLVLAVHRRKGRSPTQARRDARKAFEAALKIDPLHRQAAEEIDKRLRIRASATTGDSPDGALAAMDDFQGLLKLTPSNPYPRQNLAYVLRVAWEGRDDAKEEDKEGWAKVLATCTRLYEESAAGVERLLELDRGDTSSWKTRYDFAGILCDTGSMYTMYAGTRDLEKAEPYIRRALEVSYYRHQVAWSVALDLYRSQERWGALVPIAARCAANIVTVAGEPVPASRQEAAQILEYALGALDEEKLTAEELLDVGLVVHSRDDFARAVGLYERVLAEHPDFDVEKRKRLLRALANAQSKLGNHQGVYDAYRMQVEVYGEESSRGLFAAYRAALALGELGRHGEGVEALERIAAAPEASPALKVWSRYYAAKLTLDTPDIEAGTKALKKLLDDLASDSSADAQKVKALAQDALDKAK